MPKPHTPFQWASQASAETIDHRLKVLREAINADRRIGRSMAELGPARALGVVADVARDLIADARCTPNQVQSLHMAVPGLVDADAGISQYR